MKIYLAIPYTGREEESFEIANMEAGRLMKQGHIVFSPISHTHPIACQCEMPKHWDYWEKFDECFLEWCDEMHIVCLPGWEFSKGVTAEIDIARSFGKPIIKINKRIYHNNLCDNDEKEGDIFP